MVLESFHRFSQKARGLAPASFVIAKSIGVSLGRAALSRASDAVLLQEHDAAMQELRSVVARADSGQSFVEARPLEVRPPDRDATLLDVKLERARRLLAPCRLCALECRVDRRAGPAGVCGLGPGLARYQDFLHEGEEAEISPTHAILLAGCNYRCAYCSDWSHVDEPGQHALTSPEALARSIDARRRAGAASLSWIGGEPLVNLPGILEALTLATVSVPVVWNSNMHALPENMDLLEGVVDAFVADWKHGSDACARAVAKAPDYVEVVSRAIERASREAFTIVRHLVMPGHLECCTLPVLEEIARRLPRVRVNLMAQYRPNANVRGTPLDRRPAPEDLARARSRALALGLQLEPVGKLVGPEPTSARDDRGAPAFESSIFVDADGQVTIENLSPELKEIARELGLLPEDGPAS